VAKILPISFSLKKESIIRHFDWHSSTCEKSFLDAVGQNLGKEFFAM